MPLSGKGQYRVFLTGGPSNQNNITVYVTLSEDGTCNALGMVPFLMKTFWDGANYFGELVPGENGAGHFDWEGEWPDTMTDLLQKPIVEGTAFKIWHGPDESAPHSDWTVQVVEKCNTN